LGRIAIEVIGKLAKAGRCCAQGDGAMTAYIGNYFMVEVMDEATEFVFYPLARFMKLTCPRFLRLMIHGDAPRPLYKRVRFSGILRQCPVPSLATVCPKLYQLQLDGSSLVSGYNLTGLGGVFLLNIVLTTVGLEIVPRTYIDVMKGSDDEVS
jgi:hypothetical protein